MTPTERVELILQALPEDLRLKLSKEMRYWAPEVLLLYTNSFVNSHVVKDAADPVSVRVYAAVCGLSELDMQVKMIMDGNISQ